MLEGRVGEEDAEPGDAGGYGLGDGGGGVLAGDYDGAGGGEEEGFFFIGKGADWLAAARSLTMTASGLP